MLIGAHLLLGTVLLACPDPLLGTLTRAPDRAELIVARFLGGRHLAEGAVLGRRLSHRWIQAIAAVDAAHAASMMVLASRSPARRTLALGSAATATGFAIAAWAQARTK